MKIPELERDPWHEQCFTEFTGSGGVHIPTGDTEAFNSYPEHRWVYNRLLIAESQGLDCGLHDVVPMRYPVFCKPVTKLNERRAGRIACSEHDYRENCGAGDFWMELLAGEHVSTDFAVVRGEAAWCRHASGIPGGGGTFDYWLVEERTRPRLVKYCSEWIRANLVGYTGMVNIETIGGRITDVHLRFADQWPDLYGRKWLDALVRLHQRETWDLVDAERAEGYSVVLFGTQGSGEAYPKPGRLAAYRTTVGISSIRLTSGADRPHNDRAIPAGFRLAVINSFNLVEGLRVRAAMARDFEPQDPGNPGRPAGQPSFASQVSG
jgi:hypothetical protein